MTLFIKVKSGLYYNFKVIVVPSFTFDSTLISQSIALAKSRMRCNPKPLLIPTTSLSSYNVDTPKNDPDFYGLRYAEFVEPLLKAVQKQQKIIDNQNKKFYY